MTPRTEFTHWLIEDWTGKAPVLTICALVAITIFMLLQSVDPVVLDSLRRDLPALRSGEWWRIFTPVLVQSDGWPQFAANIAGIAIAGAAVEQRFGQWWWAGLAFIGGLAGEFAGYAWNPTGAGTSLVVCGLIGGLAAWAWRNERRRFLALEFSIYWMTALTGLALSGMVGAVALCAVLAAAGGIVCARPGVVSCIVKLSIIAMIAEAISLSALADIHGPAVLAGALAGLVFKPKGSRPAL